MAPQELWGFHHRFCRLYYPVRVVACRFERLILSPFAISALPIHFSLPFFPTRSLTTGTGMIPPKFLILDCVP